MHVSVYTEGHYIGECLGLAWTPYSPRALLPSCAVDGSNDFVSDKGADGVFAYYCQVVKHYTVF